MRNIQDLSSLTSKKSVTQQQISSLSSPDKTSAFLPNNDSIINIHSFRFLFSLIFSPRTMSQTAAFSLLNNYGQVGPDGKSNKINFQTLFDFSNL